MPDSAIPLFAKHGLQHVTVGESCTLSSASDITLLDEFIQKLCIDASYNPYVCFSEGSVVYATSHKGEVLFLAKIKPTKYRILRRLRKIMKNAASKKIQSGSVEEAKIRKGFSQDVKEWGLESLHAEYVRLFEAACRTRQKDKEWTVDRIGNRFIDFLHFCIEECKNSPRSLAPVVAVDGDRVPEDGESSENEDNDFAKEWTRSGNKPKPRHRRSKSGEKTSAKSLNKRMVHFM